MEESRERDWGVGLEGEGRWDLTYHLGEGVGDGQGLGGAGAGIRAFFLLTPPCPHGAGEAQRERGGDRELRAPSALRVGGCLSCLGGENSLQGSPGSPIPALCTAPPRDGSPSSGLSVCPAALVTIPNTVCSKLQHGGV